MTRRLLGHLLLAASLVFLAALSARVAFAPSGFTAASLVWGAFVAGGLLASLMVRSEAQRRVAARLGIRIEHGRWLPIGPPLLFPDGARMRGVWVVALAGPLAHGSLAALAWMMAIGHPAGSPVASGLMLLASLNGLLAFVHLMPASPLDGVWLARVGTRGWHDRARARRTVLTLDRAMGVAFGPVSVFALGAQSWTIIVLVVFLFVSARTAGVATYETTGTASHEG